MGNTDTLGNIDYTRQSVKTNKTKNTTTKKLKRSSNTDLTKNQG